MTTPLSVPVWLSSFQAIRRLKSSEQPVTERAQSLFPRKVRPDVILLDIAMPGLDGFHAIPRIRAACSTAHVLLISMHDEPEYLQEAVDCGAQGLVSKASLPEDLVEAIMAAARGEIMKTSPPLSKREREVIL